MTLFLLIVEVPNIVRLEHINLKLNVLFFYFLFSYLGIERKGLCA